MVGSLTRLREACRLAKHRLSADTATAIAVDLPGQRTSIRLTRTELEQLVDEPLDGFLAALDDTLDRNGVPPAHVSAVATIGGGARIPLLTQRLSQHLRTQVVTTPHPQLTAAAGASLLAATSTGRRNGDHADADRTGRCAVHATRRAGTGRAGLVAGPRGRDGRRRRRPHPWSSADRPSSSASTIGTTSRPRRRGPLVAFGLSGSRGDRRTGGLRHHPVRRRDRSRRARQPFRRQLRWHRPSRRSLRWRPSPRPPPSS